MATIKVKLRTSTVIGRPGVIYYQITHRSITKQITTNLKLSPHEWNSLTENVIINNEDDMFIQNRIDADLVILKRIVRDFANSGLSYSTEDIIRRYKSSDINVSILEFMEDQIRILINSNRLGTAQNYIKTRKNFAEFLGGINLTFAAFTEELISDYNVFLIKRGMIRNSISFYMRTMRAIYNKAVRQKLVEQSFPFTAVYTGIDATRKRAVPESIISQLYKLDLQEHTQMALARDIFIFSYLTRGMAFVDLAYLKKENIQNNTLSYFRRKTGQLLSVKIEPCIQRIIDRYSSENSPYIFPILTTMEIKGAYKEYQLGINNYNRLLGKLSKLISMDCKLTSYTSRHSWATTARNHNVPISVISAGMGHTSEQTTRIYLSSLDNSVIDAANLGVINSLLK